jgi:hypothetical protein
MRSAWWMRFSVTLVSPVTGSFGVDAAFMLLGRVGQ